MCVWPIPFLKWLSFHSIFVQRKNLKNFNHKYGSTIIIINCHHPPKSQFKLLVFLWLVLVVYGNDDEKPILFWWQFKYTLHACICGLWLTPLLTSQVISSSSFNDQFLCFVWLKSMAICRITNRLNDIKI